MSYFYALFVKNLRLCWLERLTCGFCIHICLVIDFLSARELTLVSSKTWEVPVNEMGLIATSTDRVLSYYPKPELWLSLTDDVLACLTQLTEVQSQKCFIAASSNIPCQYPKVGIYCGSNLYMNDRQNCSIQILWPGRLLPSTTHVAALVFQTVLDFA